MKSFRTWLVCDPEQALVLSEAPNVNGIVLNLQDDPSCRHWASKDGHGFMTREFECTLEEEERLDKDHVRAKELLLVCEDSEFADNFLSLIHAGILLGYPINLNFTPISSTSEANSIDSSLLRHKPMHKCFTYHENVGYGCLIARRAWMKTDVRYAIHKWHLSIDLDSFTPHSANPRHKQVFPTKYPDDTYHVKAAYAVNAAFSVIEELGLEVRSSQQKPRFTGDGKDTWNPKVFDNLKKRLSTIGIDPNEDFDWVVRGTERAIEKVLKPTLGKASPWANGDDIRDRTLSIADAIHYASLVRNFISAHKFHSLIGELGPYDVFNIQSIARRLILSSLGVWKKDFQEIAEENRNAEQGGGGNVASRRASP